MDVSENENEYVLQADLPGLTEGDVNVELDDNVLTISGERKSEHEERKDGYHRVERAFGRFSRSLRLPEGVNAEGIQANFDNGVLEVHIQKPEQHKPQKVAISVGREAKHDRGRRGHRAVRPRLTPPALSPERGAQVGSGPCSRSGPELPGSRRAHRHAPPGPRRRAARRRSCRSRPRARSRRSSRARSLRSATS